MSNVRAPRATTGIILYKGPGVVQYRVDQWLAGDIVLFAHGGALIEKEGGWPLAALGGSCKSGNRFEWAFRVPQAWQRPVGLFHNTAEDFVPLRPLWPGFAINTLFYAGILWLLFAAPFALRRRRRIKRGLCPACAYPVGDSDVCTECGVAVQGTPS